MPRPTRDQVPAELTWDLGHLYPSAAAWEADLAACVREVGGTRLTDRSTSYATLE